MALIIFRSRAASQIIMYSDAAQRLLDIIGKPMAERGVITKEQVDAALARLVEAVEQEKASRVGPADEDDSLTSRPVSLQQRAFPLIEMLRAARKQGVEVTWGI